MGRRAVRDRAWCFAALALAAVLLAAGDGSAHGMSEADRQAMLQGGYAL